MAIPRQQKETEEGVEDRRSGRPSSLLSTPLPLQTDSPLSWWGVLLAFFAFLPLSLQAQKNVAEGVALPLPEAASLSDSLFSAPDTAYIGLTRVGACDTLLLPITNHSLFPLLIDTLQLFANHSSLRLITPFLDTLTLQPGETRNLLIEFCPTDSVCVDGSLTLAGNFLSTNQWIYHQVGIRACGGRPEIVVDPPQINFRPTRINSCLVDSFVVQNVGNYPLQISQLVTSGGSFRILRPSLFPLTLLPDEKESIVVEFCPDREGNIADSLAIWSNADGGAIYRPLAGEGVIVRLLLPDTLDFGTVVVSSCRDTLMVVQNNSPLPITLTEVSLTRGLQTTPFTLLENYPQGWQKVLKPQDTLQIHLRFCPSDTGKITSDNPVVVAESEERWETVLQGVGRLPIIGFSTSTLNFPPLPIGRCRDTILTIYNFDTTSVSLITADLIKLAGAGSFEFPDPIPLPLLVKGMDSIQLRIRFCATEEGETASRITLQFEPKSEEEIEIRGSGLVPVIWLDTTHANAGANAMLTLRVWPGGLINQQDFFLKLRLNPDALFTRKVVAAGSERYSQSNDGVVEINGSHPSDLPDDGTIFQITFLGLSTGKPVNHVAIEEFDIADSILRWDTLHGVVTLSGCEVGSLPGVGKRASIRSIQPNPASSNVTLTYLSPEGRVSTLSLYDYLGGKISTITLPVGSGEPEEYLLDLQEFPRGIYMIELVEREERHLYPLLIE
ncbi:MAG: choice-of-anchor D domain-containing protein [Ignavibacteriae bacterium]|nr:choice-of-anchor D domain-containing protein [Ignavibacteriota bacterium]MCB9214857.1 choice-of-anchor D domain-containing protein [Ignavibacteria bacterium]